MFLEVIQTRVGIELLGQLKSDIVQEKKIPPGQFQPYVHNIIEEEKIT